MRSSKSPEEFFDRMNKKPAVQKILDNLESYTVEELQNIHGQPLWIRNVLALKRSRIDQNIKYEKENFAATPWTDLIKIEVRDENNPAHKFQVRRWIGEEWFMPCGRTGSMQVQIKYNDCLIADSAKFEVKISSSRGKLNTKDWSFFIQNTEAVGMMTKREYNVFVSNKLSSLADHEINTPDDIGATKEQQGLFRIIRHD